MEITGLLKNITRSQKRIWAHTHIFYINIYKQKVLTAMVLPLRIFTQWFRTINKDFVQCLKQEQKSPLKKKKTKQQNKT